MTSQKLIHECTFKAVKSSGSGGQHVNKVATKIELQFNILQSEILCNLEKERLLNKLASKLSKHGVLILQCSETSSQLKNKQIIIKRFTTLIEEALKRPKKRKPTIIPRAAIKKRIISKKHHSEKKSNRRKPDID